MGAGGGGSVATRLARQDAPPSCSPPGAVGRRALGLFPLLTTGALDPARLPGPQSRDSRVLNIETRIQFAEVVLSLL